MSLVEAPRSAIREKSKRPSQFQVVMWHRGEKNVKCASTILMNVFHMNAKEAASRVRQAFYTGRESVLESTYDVAETTSIRANIEILEHKHHDMNADQVRFTVEPL